MKVFAALFIALPVFSQQYSAPIGMKTAFRSVVTGNIVAAWVDGPVSLLRASAHHTDDRTQLEIVDGGQSFVAIRAVALNRYWTVVGSTLDSRVFCSDSVLSERALFSWIQNSNGTFSLRSKSTGKFVAVFQDDTLMTPKADPVLLRKLAAGKNASGSPQQSTPILSDLAAKPYIWKRTLLKAVSSGNDSAAKFATVLPVLKKGGSAARAGKVTTFLDSISGKRTISGIHNREPNSNPTLWTNWINNQTGKFPGLWSGDFLYSSGDISNRGTMVTEAANQWRLGAAVTLMYHMCPPTGGEACGWNGGILSALTDPQWTQLITDGTALNATFKQRLRNIGTYLQTLKNGGVEVLFRPFHEMNQGVFWWGGRTGPTGTARLFQMTHDFLLDTLGLTNLYFVWSIQDLDYNFQAYNPGDSYWDVFSMDMYNGDGYTAQKYNAMLDVAGTRIIAIAEAAIIPSSTELRAQPRWTYFCGWAELVQSSNTQSQILDSYTAVNTLSRDEMPGWNNVTRIASPGIFRNQNPGRLTVRRSGLEFEVSVLGRILGKKWLPE